MRKTSRIRRGLTVTSFVLASVCLLGFAERAYACLQAVTALECELNVDISTPTLGTYCCTGYDTFGATIPPQSFCACGLGLPNLGSGSCIISITGVTVNDTGSGALLGAFDFAANGTASASFASVQSGPAWAGFWGELQASLVAGQLVDLCWDLVLDPSCAPIDYKNELLATFVGTGEADASGNVFNDSHLNIEQPATVTLTGTGVPTLSEWGLLVLSLAFAGLGAWTLKNRNNSIEQSATAIA
jgi:hypothetical protein